MADQNPELQAKLDELQQELENGELTEKGFSKRRTLLLTQYQFAPDVLTAGGRTLRVHSVENTTHPSNNGSRTNTILGAPPHPEQSSSPRELRSASSSIYLNPRRAQDGQNPTPGGSRTPSFYQTNPSSRASSEGFTAYTPARYDGPDGDYAFNPFAEADEPTPRADTRSNTLLNSQGYFSDFAGQQVADYSQDGPNGDTQNRYLSGVEAFSPTNNQVPPFEDRTQVSGWTMLNPQLPLEPRELDFDIFDPHNSNVPMTKFDSIAAILRHRGREIPRNSAFMVLDSKGKELAMITWEKLATRAEKVAQVIREKSSLYTGDRVALIYRATEIIDFAVSLLACFIAGVVAVPIVDFQQYGTLLDILTQTQTHLALTTDFNLKLFQRDIQEHRMSWPKGVEWWKTDEFGSYHPKRKDEIPALRPHDIAYFEYTMAPTGEYRGIVHTHRTIMHQMSVLSALIQTAPSPASARDKIASALRDKNGHRVAGGGAGEITFSYLDPRQSIGLIFGVLLTVYGGHSTVWADPKVMITPGLYANLITRYKTTLMLADYNELRRVVYNYQNDPLKTREFQKKFDPSFASVKLCLIDTLTVDSEFHGMLGDRYLRPLGNPRANEVVAPMLCLPEHGGMVISMRDSIGLEHQLGVSLDVDHSEHGSSMTPRDPRRLSRANTLVSGVTTLLGHDNTKASTEIEGRGNLGELLIDKEALKINEIVVVAHGEEARKRSDDQSTVRVGAFGHPIPGASLAIVDPDTQLLCLPNTVGEIWVDSPALSGGFWSLPKLTQGIFRAVPYRYMAESPTPVPLKEEYLRTGLLGFVSGGKVYVLGLYEDRLRQKVEWTEKDTLEPEYRYFFIQHMITSIGRNLSGIFACSIFDIHINDEYLPVILLESSAASTAPLPGGGAPRQLDFALLDSMAERCMDVLYKEHHVRVYCVLITAPDTLPRMVKNGRKEIGNMLCRRDFNSGVLPCVHVKFGAERAVLNLPIGVDLVGGIWSNAASKDRREMLQGQEKQYTGVDMRHVVIDDVTSRALTDFSNIVDLLQLRVARQTEDLALCAIDSRGREGKGITWKKLDLKIAAVAVYLRNKIKLREGDHVILMYTHSEDYVYAVYACFCMGIIAVPLAILDTNRLHEDVPAFLHIVSDFRVKAVLVNNEVDAMLKSKIVSTHIKHTATAMKVSIPHQYNTARPSKQSNGCRELGFTMHPQWVQPSRPALIWTYWTPDQRRQSVQLSHSTIMGICKVQKETCQMISGKSILGCVRGSNGLGFVYTCLLGIFLGASTYLVSPVDFAQNPISLFLALNRYKIKDTYSTGQMLEHAMNSIKASDIKLPDLHNLMIAADGRPKTDIFSRVRLHFANSGLDSTAINTIYSHVLNPFIASRSYMSIKPMELWLDTRALRRGLVIPVDPEQDPSALLVQDSGMAPISTSIAIVNPNTCQLCQVGEYGEIWVQSEANVSCIYKSNDPLDAERFNGIINGGDPMARYMRTGDFGFLHYTSRRVGPRGSQVELQCLFVLGSIGETFEVNGLLHFPIDIETSVEKSHRNIVPGGCIVFQAGGTIVVVAEVSRRSYLASMVPVVVNAVLNEHQLIVDKVAFVAQGDFARSRLNEKQRGRIMATWVLRKLNTIAQFSIRDTIDDDEEQRQFLIKHETSMKSSGTHSLRVAATMNAAVSTANDEQNPYLSNGRPRDSLNSRSSSVGMDGFPVSVLTAAELSPPAGLDDRMMDPNPMDEFRFDSQTGFTSDSSTTARAASRQSASSHHKTDSSGARTIHELSSTYESRGGEVTGTSPAFPLRRISLSDRSMHERDSPHIPHPQHFYGAPMEPEPAAPPRPPKIEPTLEIPYRTKPIMSPPQLLQPSMGQPSSKLRVVNDEQLIDLDISVEEAIRRASRPTSQSIDGQMPAGHYPNRLSSFGYPMDTIGRGGGGAGGVGGGVRGDLGGLPSQRPRYDGSEWDR